MAQAQDIINAAGRLIGELRGDRVFGPTTEMPQLLVSLNQMLGEWSASGIGIHAVTRDTHVSNGSASYTMGTGATINVARPIKITGFEVVSAAGVRKGAAVITSQEWAQPKYFDDAATSDHADVVFPDYGHTACTLRLWPKPNSGGTMAIYSLKALTSFALVSTTVDLPPGYEEALVYGFAVKIAPEFGKQAPETVAAIATRGRNNLAALNAQLRPAAVEAK